MKTFFKKILVQSFIAFTSLCFFACQEYEINSQPEAPLNIQIDALEEYTVLASSPSNVVFNISSNTPWTIECDQQWCIVTPSMSASSSLVSEIVVKCEPNNDAKQRVATLTIKAEGIENVKTVKLTQVSKENLVVIPYDGIVPTEGGAISFNIVSNKPWEIIPSTQFLENIDKTSGAGNETGEKETITITVPKNPGSLRKGTITVKTEFEEYTFEIVQDGVVIEQEEPSESGTIDFGGNESEKIVKIRSNQVWKVEVAKEDKDWLSAEKISENELKVAVKENNKLSVREGILKLTTEDLIPGFEGIEFTVTQNPNFWFDGNDWTIDENTGDVKVSNKGSNTINSNFVFRKGRISFDFAELNLLEKSILEFNFWPNAGNTNFHFYLRSDEQCQFTCGGSGFAWQQSKFELTQEEVNKIRKVEFEVNDDPDNIGKLCIKLIIDGVEKYSFNNKTNVYATEDPQNPGQVVHLGFREITEGNYFVIKSITHIPAE